MSPHESLLEDAGSFFIKDNYDVKSSQRHVYLLITHVLLKINNTGTEFLVLIINGRREMSIARVYSDEIRIV